MGDCLRGGGAAYRGAMRHLALALVLLGCSADPVIAPRDCTPGTTTTCACPGASGVQTCTAAGTVGACVCPDGGGGADAVAVADVLRADVVDAAPPRDVPLRPADPQCADRLTARDWCALSDGGGLCVDRTSDPMNCGRCGARCTGALSECFDGVCFLPFDGGAPDATR